MLELLEEDSLMLVRWASSLECTSGVARREREGSLTAAQSATSLERLRYLKHRWQEILPSAVLRDLAERLLRVHPLRAADSLQLAAAIIAAEREPVKLDLVSLDAQAHLSVLFLLHRDSRVQLRSAARGQPGRQESRDREPHRGRRENPRVPRADLENERRQRAR